MVKLEAGKGRLGIEWVCGLVGEWVGGLMGGWVVGEMKDGRTNFGNDIIFVHTCSYEIK